MDLKLSSKVSNKKIKAKKIPRKNKKGFKSILSDIIYTNKKEAQEDDAVWSYLILFPFLIIAFAVLIRDLTNLQIVNGSVYLAQSEENQIAIKKEPAYRGAILDRNGKILAQNVSSMNVYISLDNYLDDSGEIDTETLRKTSDALQNLLKGNWKNKKSTEGEEVYSSIEEKVVEVYLENPYFTDILIATDIDDDTAINVKASLNELVGVYLDNGNKRYYPEKEIYAQLLGYTGEVTAEDLEKLDYVDSTDVVGRTGLEREYDKALIGQAGKTAYEVDAYGRAISEDKYTLNETVAGDNLYLSIDTDLQKQSYTTLEKAVGEYGATGGAIIVENVSNGELLSITSYPSYDNNLFVGGISIEDYNTLVSNDKNPLLNRAIAAQVPPGSVFKTIVAASALEAGALTRDTLYTSRNGYSFSNGALFQEYHNNSYGTLNLIDALSVSSNIYFCEVIRHWNMEALDYYLDRFGIGKYTNIDVPGEAPGRLPSPENKIALANSTSPWLDPVWYPEGDSCNSVIGQGITLVTPIQMANWTSAIANGGTLNTPHIGKYLENTEKKKEEIPYTPLLENVVSDKSLSVVREGMWSAVNGPRATIVLNNVPGVSIAAKTGTAEFGALNAKGIYEHTHAWVTTFFPYESPKYVVTVFLEDGGQSYNAVNVAREIITWMRDHSLL